MRNKQFCLIRDCFRLLKQPSSNYVEFEAPWHRQAHSYHPILGTNSSAARFCSIRRIETSVNCVKIIKIFFIWFCVDALSASSFILQYNHWFILIRLRLSTEAHYVDLVGVGNSTTCLFQVLGPSAEAAFVEEIIIQKFGSLSVDSRALFDLLTEDPWITEAFNSVQILSGELNPANPSSSKANFQDQPLGSKLVNAGILSQAELDQLLIDYQQFASRQRFGEYLLLNLKVKPKVMQFLIDPLLHYQNGFNDKRLGQRLVELDFINSSELNQALELQKSSNKRLGEILQERGSLSPETAAFFSGISINENGDLVL